MVNKKFWGTPKKQKAGITGWGKATAKTQRKGLHWNLGALQVSKLREDGCWMDWPPFSYPKDPIPLFVKYKAAEAILPGWESEWAVKLERQGNALCEGCYPNMLHSVTHLVPPAGGFEDKPQTNTRPKPRTAKYVRKTSIIKEMYQILLTELICKKKMLNRTNKMKL